MTRDELLEAEQDLQQALVLRIAERERSHTALMIASAVPVLIVPLLIAYRLLTPVI